MVRAEATAKYIRTSAQKAGLVLDLIRGKNVNSALSALQGAVQHGTAYRDNRHRPPHPNDRAAVDLLIVNWPAPPGVPVSPAQLLAAVREHDIWLWARQKPHDRATKNAAPRLRSQIGRAHV